MQPEKRKISAMHERFGVLPDKRCEDCSNLIKGYCGGTFVRKCIVYGATHSAASDWRKKYIACGLFNQQWDYGEIIHSLKGTPKAEAVELRLDGQMDLFGEE